MVSKGLNCIQFTFVTCILLIIKSETIKECATCIRVDSTCYNRSHVLVLKAPFRNTIVINKMGIFRSENVLFYSFEPNINDPEYAKIAFVNLDTDNITGIIGNDGKVRNFGTFDIDQENQILYLGGSNGVFYINLRNMTNTPTPYSSFGEHVVNVVYHRKGIYFIKDNHKDILLKNESSFEVALSDTHVIKNFVITNNGDIVYLNTMGLFVKKFNVPPFRISQNAFFRGLTIDNDGYIYANWLDNLYRVDIESDVSKSTLRKVADIPGLGSVTFDNNNNVLYTSSKHLYKLTPTAYKDC